MGHPCSGNGTQVRVLGPKTDMNPMALVSTPPSSPAYYAYPAATLKSAGDALGRSVERLSSGNRIIQISDDVAATTIAAGLQSQLSSLKQASSNIAQGSSLLEVAAGGLQQISDLFGRLRSIAAQAAGGGLTTNQADYLQQQFSDALTQIDSVAGTTRFNGISLLDGTLASGTSINTGGGNNIHLAIASAKTAALFGGAVPSVATHADAVAAQASVANALDKLQPILNKVIGNRSGFDFAAGNVQRSITGINAAHSALVDTDIAFESHVLAGDTLKVNSAVAVVAQLRLLQPGLLALVRG